MAAEHWTPVYNNEFLKIATELYLVTSEMENGPSARVRGTRTESLF